ncbi:MAG TPA: hydantoinase/oxoprolinase family protein [Nocardioidaceae bacterium]|nr:hydantoinase/oxoprolinase family protein [Nocardioidaceae bacterium]
MTQRSIRIGIDTGGTFTDVVAVDEHSGQMATTKTPSTPQDPAIGFMAGVHKVLETLGLGGESISAVSHGTTVATNKLLEGKVENLGFITTEGYEFVLEIARQSVPDGYGNSYFWVKPDRIVPAHRVKTVPGRLIVTGEELRPFDEAAAAETARWFKAQGINTIGVCFLHSYANDAHETAMRAVLAREHPEATISISSEVLREYREYERSITTLVDAAVKPNIRTYVENISAHLNAFAASAGRSAVSTSAGLREEAGPPNHPSLAGSLRGPDPSTVGPAPSLRPSAAEAATRRVPFYVMKSNGGVLSAEEVVHQPITTVLSGPAAGALGAAVVAEKAGFPQVVTCDGGGTSTDVTVVIDGNPALTTEGHVGAYPSKIPMIDVVTVGAGGGSIAWISPEGTLKVGPHSAGADPGPMCYRTGGTEPTITDAHVLLGRIPPHLLGGEVPLDVDAARTGLEKLAADLDLSLEACATGVLEISAWNQANALRQITVNRGLDVRDFTMVTFGGSGSLLACRLVDILSLQGVLVPMNPGNLSAYGLLTVDVRNDYVQTSVCRASGLEPATVQGTFDDLSAKADAALAREGFAEAQRQYLRTADIRYYGQAYEVRVDVPSGPVTEELFAQVAKAFHDEHKALYGYDFRDDTRQEVEWVNLRVTGVGPIRKPDIREIAAGSGAESARTGSRQVYFEDWAEVPVYDRARLGAGDVVEGPAVFEEFSSTVPLHPGFTATVDSYGNLVITRSES